MGLIQKGLMVGMLEVNCYVLGDEETKEAVVIDPGGDEHEILEVLQYHGLNLKLIIDTHGHFDHVDANQPLKDATGALGVEWATAQCEELLERGVPGIHFYTLNKSPATRQITQRLFGG